MKIIERICRFFPSVDYAEEVIRLKRELLIKERECETVKKLWGESLEENAILLKKLKSSIVCTRGQYDKGGHL